MCVQHHVRSSSGGSRQELGTHPGYEQAAASEASEKSSLLRSMVCTSSTGPLVALRGWPRTSLHIHSLDEA